MIDVHVHFRDGVQQEKETIKHGFAVAHKAGIFSCFDMPNTAPPLTTKEAIMNRLEMGQHSVETIDKNAIYRAYAGLTLEPGQIENMVALHRELFPRLVGFKMFAGHSTGNTGMFRLIVDWCSTITTSSSPIVKDKSHLIEVYNALDIRKCSIFVFSGTLHEKMALYRKTGDSQEVNKSLNTVSF